MGTDTIAFFSRIFRMRFALYKREREEREKKEENRRSIMARRAVIHPRLTIVCQAKHMRYFSRNY